MLKKYSNILNLDATISKELFDGVNYPWEVLPKIKEYILMKGQTLGDDYLEKNNCSRFSGYIFAGNVICGTLKTLIFSETQYSEFKKKLEILKS